MTVQELISLLERQPLDMPVCFEREDEILHAVTIERDEISVPGKGSFDHVILGVT